MPVTLRPAGRREARSRAHPGVRYRRVALSNTTLGALLASINAYGESAGLAGPPGEGTAADSASPASRR
jgi:hypothetical protein